MDESQVEIMYRSPVDIYIGPWVDELMEGVERTGARRVVIDSLAGLRIAALDETTFETPDLFRVERISDSAVSHLSDNVMLLNYVNDHGSIQQAMSVIKSRTGPSPAQEPEVSDRP